MILDSTESSVVLDFWRWSAVKTTSTKLANNKGNTAATTATAASTKMKKFTKKSLVIGRIHNRLNHLCDTPIHMCRMHILYATNLFIFLPNRVHSLAISFALCAFVRRFGFSVGSCWKSFIHNEWVSWMLLVSLSVASMRC